MADAVVILLQDEYRVIYRIGSNVYKKRRIGLDYEGMVGLYINSLNSPYCVRTIAFEQRPRGDRLVTEYVAGLTWHQTYNQSTTLLETQALSLKILNIVTTLPFTHYDLHMNNVIIQEKTGLVKLIDFGFSSIPYEACDPSIKYIECTYSTLSCGILPSVADPGYDLMLIVLSLSKQAKRFGSQSLTNYCTEVIKKAGFDHPLFYGHENYLSIEVITRYRFLLYEDKVPLLPPSTKRIGYVQLLNKLEGLRVEAIQYLQEKYSCDSDDASRMTAEIGGVKLHEWLELNERRVYGALYAYKRERIEVRVIPSVEELRRVMSRE